MHKRARSEQVKKTMPELVIFAPIGEQQYSMLTEQAKDHAETKRWVVSDLLKGSSTAKVLFNENHAPSVEAASIMTGGLHGVLDAGAHIDDLTKVGTFDRLKVLNHMEAHESDVRALVVVGTLPVCKQMLKTYAESKGISLPDIETAGPDEVYALRTNEKAAYISHPVRDNITEPVPAEESFVGVSA